MLAVTTCYPNLTLPWLLLYDMVCRLPQFEDFGNSNAFRLLERYRERANCFNDDIQGTAAVCLAGLMASHPLTKKKSLREHTFLFYGAGEAGIGIANLLSSAIAKESGISIEDARKHCFFVDSQGLITDARVKQGAAAGFAEHKKDYAHDISMLRIADTGEKKGEHLLISQSYITCNSTQLLQA